MSHTHSRPEWMRILAHSSYQQIKPLYESLTLNIAYQTIRSPEIGLVQLQGKMGGSGNRFYIGDATVTRAVILFENKYYGFSYALGRDKEHAQLSALIDALMQHPSYQSQLMTQVIQPLFIELENQTIKRQQEVESSRVDFFTLVRGEDE